MTDQTLLPLRPCRWLAWLLPLLFLLAGCGTTKTYTPNVVAGPAKPADYPIPLYTIDTPVPRPCEVIGQLAIGDTEFTMGGSLTSVMKTLMDTAHAKGADAVQLLSLEKPDFSSAHYRLKADLLRYSSAWETVELSENDFIIYLQQHRQTLDPMPAGDTEYKISFEKITAPPPVK